LVGGRWGGGGGGHFFDRNPSSSRGVTPIWGASKCDGQLKKKSVEEFNGREDFHLFRILNVGRRSKGLGASSHI